MSEALGPSTIGTGSALAGSNVAGTSMGVNSFGDVLYSDTYGGHIYEFPSTMWTQSPVPAPTLLASVSNPGGVAVDKNNNLYINFAYNDYVAKIPYIPGANGADGTYATISTPGSSTPACTGNDTAECLESNANPSGSDSVAMVFDAQGDLFITTRDTGTTPNAIYECPATTCLDGGSTAATLIYQEPTASASTSQLNLGDIAFDAAGNLFFTDSVVASTSNNASSSSNLKELTYTSGSGYSTTPVTIYTYTPAASSISGGYNGETTAVAVNKNTNVVYLFQLGGGVLAFPENSGAITEGYVVSTQTAKAGALGPNGNLYVEFNNGNEVMEKILLNPVTAPTPASGSSSTTASFTTVLNDGTACTPTVTYSFGGSSAAAFSAATNTSVTCSSTTISGGAGGSGVTLSSGSAVGGTLTFTPTIGGISSAVMTATDQAGNSGTANVAGSATGTLATPTFSPAGGAYGSVQTVTISSASGGASIYYTTDGSTPTSSSTLYTAPITVSASENLSAIAVESGDTTSGVGTASYTINLAPTGPPDFTPAAGTYTSAQMVTITSSTPGAVIYYTTDGSTPTTSSTVYSGPITVSATETINAFAQAPGAIASSVVSAAYTINLPASAVQDVVISQNTLIGDVPSSGGGLSGGTPAGDTMAVDSSGNVIMADTYGGQVLLFPVAGGGPTVIGSGSGTNPAGVAVDAQGNLYVATAYGPILKLPKTGTETWAALGAAQPSNGPPYPVGTPNCTGNDTVECIMASGTEGGTTSVLFDAAGDMIYATSASNGTNPNAIIKVPAASLYNGTAPGTVLYQEPTSSSGTTTGQLELGGLALDSSNDVFFTDSAINTNVSEESFSSNLKELPVSSSSTTTGYAASPTVIYSYAVSSASQYDAEIDGVAVAPNGTVYALIQNTIGVLAFPDNNGAYSSSSAYLISPQNGKLMVMDHQGNLFVENYQSGDVMSYIALNNITATAGPTASTTTATNLVTVLNDGGCGSSPTVTFTSTSQVFSAATSGACSAAGLSSASIPTTLSFTPTAAGINTATLTATDSAGNSGTATVVGNATGTLAAPTFSPAAGTYTSIQTVSISDADGGAQIYYTTDGSTPSTSSTLYTGPISVISTETINAIAVESGDTTSSQASATYTLNIPATAAPAASEPSGTYGTPQLITLSDSSPDAQIFYTTDGSTATAASTPYTGPIPVTGNETINAVASSPGAATSTMSSFAYTITLAASAYQDVVMNQQTKLGTLPSGGGPQSGQEPAGDTIAINSLGDVILGNTYGGKVYLFTPQGTMSTIGSLSNVEGAAVDSANNLYLGYAYSGGGTVVKVPYVSGNYVALTQPGGSTPACTGTDTTECTITTLATGGADVVSMVFDAKGDLFYATANADATSGTNNTLFECTAACLKSGSPAPVKLYTEPTSTAPTTAGQLSIGGLALDSAGDVFFTDSAIATGSNNQESFSSNVNELPVSSGTSTGYAASPTVIYTYTPSTPAQSDAEIDGVAVAPNGTLYFLIQNTIGIEAIPLVSGTYSSSQAYLVSSVPSGTSFGGKLMGSDIYGNLYVADNNNSANIFEIAVDNITVPGTQVATPASTATNVYTITNDTACSGSPSVSFTAAGTDSSAFSAATTGTCSAVGVSSGQFATTVTFNPSNSGGNSATLTATDSNGGTGTAEVSAVATPATQAVAPTFSPAGGNYSSAQTVTLSTTTPNASIYYTIDGTTPGTTVGGSTMLYSGPISVATSETINAIAVAANVQQSAVATATYTLPAATPTFSPGAGTYTSVQTVTIASTTPNAQIFYTLDGSTPGTSAGGSTMAYTGPISVGVSETVNAIATATGFGTSSMASAVYAINLPAAATPTFSVAGGTYTTVQTVSLSDATSGATIYYTIDGTTPSPTGAGTTMTYTTPISVGANETINAIAVANGYSTSALATAIYVINLPTPSMAISSKQTTINVPNGGSGTATVTLTTNATFPAPVTSGNEVTSGGVALTCSGYLPLGYTCSVSPATLTPGPNASVTSTVTVKAGSSTTTTSALRSRSGVLFAGTMLAGALALFGLRKRRWMAVTLMLLLSFGGFSLLSGCATTQKETGPTSSQIIITATSVVNQTTETATVPFIVTTQQ